MIQFLKNYIQVFAQLTNKDGSFLISRENTNNFSWNDLKGKIIIIRTCIDTCYNRTISRFKENNPNYTDEELEKYMERKKAIFKWYKFSNEFIEKIDKISIAKRK